MLNTVLKMGLLAFVIGVCCKPVQVRADEAADFLESYKSKCEALQLKYRNFEAEFTDTIRPEEGVQTIRVCGTSYLRISGKVATGRNSRYTFQVNKAGNGFTLDSVIMNGTNNMRDPGDYFTMWTSPWAAWQARKSVYEQLSNNVYKPASVSHDEARGECTFLLRYTDPAYSHCMSLNVFSTTNGYSLVEQRITGLALAGTKINYAKDGAIEEIEFAKVADDGSKSVVAHFVTTKFKFLQDDAPETDFTLSAYGLPEPEGIVWEQPTLWWLYLAAGAVALFVVSLAAGWAYRRQQRKTHK